MQKEVIFIADSLDNAHKFKGILDGLDCHVQSSSSAGCRKLLEHADNFDLVIYEARENVSAHVAELETLLHDVENTALLLIVDPMYLTDFRLPVQMRSDFVVHGASNEECRLRIKQLLWPGTESSKDDCVVIDALTVNLATYQVTLHGKPLDFTYLEYALLAFLVTHPGRTYSRDTLLKRVWGFDYYGGSRTVDVHVRRIRAKLGPDLSEHIETVRSVGYLWTA